MSELITIARPCLALLLLALAGSGCQNHSPAAAQGAPAGSELTTPDKSGDLYNALGAREGIERIVEDLLYLIVDDKRIAFQFKGLNVERFHTNLSAQICELAGGPCEYEGMSMAESHQAMDITDTQFNALVENLILAMEQNNIATGAQNRLLGKLAPLHPAIVTQ
jgi:hemoglobin